MILQARGREVSLEFYLSCLPDRRFPDVLAARDVDDLVRHQVAKIEAAVEAIGESGQRAALITVQMCASVPKQRKNSCNDIRGLNWIELNVIGCALCSDALRLRAQ